MHRSRAVSIAERTEFRGTESVPKSDKMSAAPRSRQTSRLVAGGLLIVIFAMVAVSGLGRANAQFCEDGHWIDAVLDDGRLIRLEDGSLWQVDRMTPSHHLFGCPFRTSLFVATDLSTKTTTKLFAPVDYGEDRVKEAQGSQARFRCIQFADAASGVAGTTATSSAQRIRIRADGRGCDVAPPARSRVN
jgi:hypothetical protein